MKKKTTLFFLILICMTPFFYAQSPRLVLLEEFSNTKCGPCIAFSPRLDSLLMVRLGEVVSIQYHVGWPASNDEFYLNQQESQDERIKFYDVTGVPFINLNGTPVRTVASTISDEIDNYLQEPIQINLGLESKTENGKLFVKVISTAIQTIENANLRLFVAVVEEEVTSEQNKLHYTNIFRKMLPDANGYELPDQMQAGQQDVFENEWEISGFYNEKELAVVAFIQDISNHQVYQAAYAPRATDKTDAAKVVLVENVPSKICTPHFTPKIRFRNIGKNPMTSAKLNISINDCIQQTDWSGELQYLENEQIVSPDFTEYQLAEGSAMNKVEIWLSDINGTEGCSEKYVTTFENSLVIKNQVQLTLFTDKKPEEISWKLFNSAGDVVDEVKSYSEPRHFYKRILSVDSDDCYQLIFNDTGGNGIAGENGNGYYKLEQIDETGKHKLITQADYKSAEHDVYFKMENVIPAGIGSLNEDVMELFYDVNTKTLFFDDKGLCKDIIVYNLVGEAVMELKAFSDNALHLEELSKGVYLMRIEVAGKLMTRKIVIK